MRSTFARRCLRVFMVSVGLSFLGCGPTRSNAPPPQAPRAEIAADGGLPAPARSPAKGVIVPSDTGVGATPAGSGTTTGTAGGGTVDKAIGNPPAGGN